MKRRRATVKQLLVDEAGGRCGKCGYDKYVGALHFHHTDPSTKSFNVSGFSARMALESLREEALKCTLLCANCHAEVEGGVLTL